MTKTTSRKMGFLEKLIVVIHDEMAGTASGSAMVKIKTKIDFELFKKAWHVLFQRHPFLRATLRIEDKNYFFDINAHFSDIPIKHIQSNDLAKLDNEYSRGIIKPFQLDRYFWRTTLFTTQETSYILLGIAHTISDGTSISWLLGDLLRIILELKSGKEPDTQSRPVPPAIDEILDRDRFSVPKETAELLTNDLVFENEASLTSATSQNLLRSLDPEVFTKLLAACREHGVTITSAMCAALTLSLLELKSNKTDALTLSIAFSLRSFTKTPVSGQDLAFYAHQLLFQLDLKHDIDFWHLAKQAKQKYSQAFHEYQLLPADNDDFYDELAAALQNNLKQKQFFVPYTISNVGPVDSAFTGCDEFNIDGFYFTAMNKAVFGFIVFAATINNKLCFDFNFASPALSVETATKLADGMIRHLVDNLA